MVRHTAMSRKRTESTVNVDESDIKITLKLKYHMAGNFRGVLIFFISCDPAHLPKLDEAVISLIPKSAKVNDRFQTKLRQILMMP